MLIQAFWPLSLVPSGLGLFWTLMLACLQGASDRELPSARVFLSMAGLCGALACPRPQCRLLCVCVSVCLCVVIGHQHSVQLDTPEFSA